MRRAENLNLRPPFADHYIEVEDVTAHWRRKHWRITGERKARACFVERHALVLDLQSHGSAEDAERPFDVFKDRKRSRLIDVGHTDAPIEVFE